MLPPVAGGRTCRGYSASTSQSTCRGHTRSVRRWGTRRPTGARSPRRALALPRARLRSSCGGSPDGDASAPPSPAVIADAGTSPPPGSVSSVPHDRNVPRTRPPSNAADKRLEVPVRLQLLGDLCHVRAVKEGGGQCVEEGGQLLFAGLADLDGHGRTISPADARPIRHQLDYGLDECVLARTLDGMKTIGVTELRQRTAAILEDLRRGDEPVAILQRSRPAAYLVSADQFEADRDELRAARRALFLREVREAEAEYTAGGIDGPIPISIASSATLNGRA